jgi:hypothetical protein
MTAMIDESSSHSDLSPLLRRAVRHLADSPEPNDVWRQRLLRRLDVAARPDGDRVGGGADGVPRIWSARPTAVIAAALVCIVLGGVAGAAGYAALRRPVPGDVGAASVGDGLQRVRFVFSAPAAARVAIVGDFNGWNPTALPMRRASDGATWEIVVPLAPGRYAYSFVVDGALAPDPQAPRAGDDDFGSPNSVVLVQGS